MNVMNDEIMGPGQTFRCKRVQRFALFCATGEPRAAPIRQQEVGRESGNAEGG
jgi:hypothetical protein